MERALCDTDTLSEIIKAVDPRMANRATLYIKTYGTLTFTSVTAMEILFGLYRKQARVQIENTLAVFESHEEILPGQDDYRLAATILGALDRRGTPIGKLDPLIAACALNRNLILATGNARHFGFIQDADFPLRLEDWRLS